MEAILIVEGVGAWKSFDEIEDSLTLDELLYLHKHLIKTKHNHYKMLAAFQGIDMQGDDEEGPSGADDLPPEVLEHERAWKEKKAADIASGEAAKQEMDAFKLGYSRQ